MCVCFSRFSLSHFLGLCVWIAYYNVLWIRGSSWNGRGGTQPSLHTRVKENQTKIDWLTWSSSFVNKYLPTNKASTANGQFCFIFEIRGFDYSLGFFFSFSTFHSISVVFLYLFDMWMVERWWYGICDWLNRLRKRQIFCAQWNNDDCCFDVSISYFVVFRTVYVICLVFFRRLLWCLISLAFILFFRKFIKFRKEGNSWSGQSLMVFSNSASFWMF